MKQQSISKNYILHTVYQFFTLFAPLITAPYISRVLGAKGVGIYSYTSSVVAFFSMFAVLGTSIYGQRVIARSRDDKKELTDNFWSIAVISLITTSICTVVWLVFINNYEQYKIYFLILSIDLFSGVFDIIWFYSGIERFNIIIIRNLLVRIVSILFLFLFVKTKEHVGVYIAIMAIGKLFGNLTLWFTLKYFIDPITCSKITILPHLKETIKYFIPTVAASVYTYLDKVMLGAFTDSTAENGFYEQASRIINIGCIFLSSLNTVTSPRMSYLFYQNNDDEVKQKLEKTLAFIFTAGIPISVGIGTLSANFVPWFFGPEFQKTVVILQIGCPLALLLGLHNFLSTQYLIPSGQRVRSTKGVIVGACVDFICNFFLIPRFQSIGAIISTIIAEISIILVYFYMSKEFISFHVFWKYIPKQIIAAVGMALLILLVGRNHTGSIIITLMQVILGGTIYISILLLLKEQFSMEMISGILQRIRNKYL